MTIGLTRIPHKDCMALFTVGFAFCSQQNKNSSTSNRVHAADSRDFQTYSAKSSR